MLKQLLPYLAPLIFVVILGLRMSRARNGRPVKPERLWIRPAIIAILMAYMLVTSPRPDLFGLGLYALAAVLGVGAGYLLSRHQELTLDPQTGAITSKMSVFGMILFFCMFAGRYAFRTFVNGGQAPDKLAAHSTQITLYSDAALLFLLAMFSAQACEIWRRTRPLLAEHAARTAKPAADQT